MREPIEYLPQREIFSADFPSYLRACIQEAGYNDDVVKSL